MSALLLSPAGCALPGGLPPLPDVPAVPAAPLPLPRPDADKEGGKAGAADKPKADDRRLFPDRPPPPASPDAPAVRGTPASAGGPLPLDEVLAAVERHYPLLRAVEQERAIAGGRLLSALGVFDFNLAAGTDWTSGTYDNFRSTFGVTQGLPVAGLGLFAGYRTGTGTFSTSTIGGRTADGGEFRAGLSVPLLRDRAIDRPRATVQQARLDLQLAEPLIERQRLDFTRAAARTYWNWVAAGYRLRLADELVKLATVRDEQLKGRVAGREFAPIERTDNQQNIALRNGVKVQAERAFQQATVELSLFLRDATGSPTLAGVDRLPAFPDVGKVDPAAFDALLQTAIARRPEPERLRLQRDRVAVEFALAENQMYPSLNATLSAGQDAGPGSSSASGPRGLDRTTLNAGLAFALPVQRRDARGRMTGARALMAQLDAQLQQAQDVIRAEVQDAFSAAERAAEFHAQAVARVDLARQVAEGERALLAAGQSTVLVVTLREQAAFDAEVIAVGAKQEYFRALADLAAATGRPMSR